MRRAGWWLFAAMAVGLVAGAVAIYAVARGEWAERGRFMGQCLQERKEYECTALWRAGRGTVDLILAPLPSGR